MTKTLNNKDMKDLSQNVSDVQVFGNPGAWKLICKASSENEGWMKSTKAMEIPGVGCLVQVSTQQENSEITKFDYPMMDMDDSEDESDGGTEVSDDDDIDYEDDEDSDEESEDETEITITKNGSYAVAEALTFVPGVRIAEKTVGTEVVFRALVPIIPARNHEG